MYISVRIVLTQRRALDYSQFLYNQELFLVNVYRSKQFLLGTPSISLFTKLLKKINSWLNTIQVQTQDVFQRSFNRERQFLGFYKTTGLKK